MKLLIIGDLHLGKSTSLGKPISGSHINSRIIDQFNLLNWTLEQAIEKCVSDIVFTGDICESSSPQYSLTDFFISYLKRCEEYGIHVHVIAGNHDLKKSGENLYSYLDIISTAELPLVTVYKDSATVLFENVGLTLLPYRDRRILNFDLTSDALDVVKNSILYECEGIPAHFKKILIGHYALEGALFTGDEIDNMSNELILPLNVFEDYDFVWMGHVHPPQVMSKDPYIAHIGSLDISNFGESEQVKILICYDSETNSFNEIPIPTRPLKEISISIPETEFDSTEFVLSRLSSIDVKNAILRIKIELESAGLERVNRKKIEELLYNNGAFYICSFHESKISIENISELEIENSINYIDAIKSWAEIENFSSQEERDFFIDTANSYVQELQTKEIKENI